MVFVLVSGWGLVGVACAQPGSAQQAEAQLLLIFKDFMDVFEEGEEPAPEEMAALVRRLNSLSLYLWDGLAAELERPTASKQTMARQHQMLAAVTSLQMILSTGLLNESPVWQSLRLRAKKDAALKEMPGMEELAPALGMLAAYLIADLKTQTPAAAAPASGP